MKTLFTIAYSAALLAIYVPVQSQSQETPLARYDVKKDVKKVGEERERKKSNDTKRAETSNQIKREQRVELLNAPVENYKSQKSNLVNGKVGPNGEELFMKRTKYYYLNSEGKRVKVKHSEIKDSPKHS